MALAKRKLLGDTTNMNIVTREAKVRVGDYTRHLDKVLLDTGANSGSYAGPGVVELFPFAEVQPCSHHVRLGDGITVVHLTEMVTLEVAIYDEDDQFTEFISTEFYIMPSLGLELIIGLQEILGNYYDIFLSILERARAKQPRDRIGRLTQLYQLMKNELCSESPRKKKLQGYSREAKAVGSWYDKHKYRVTHDKKHTTTTIVARVQSHKRNNNRKRLLIKILNLR
jgi:hypothetical protein